MKCWAYAKYLTAWLVRIHKKNYSYASNVPLEAASNPFEHLFASTNMHGVPENMGIKNAKEKIQTKTERKHRQKILEA